MRGRIETSVGVVLSFLYTRKAMPLSPPTATGKYGLDGPHGPKATFYLDWFK